MDTRTARVFNRAADIIEQSRTTVLEPLQTPPEGKWRYWIMLGGRGTGKTFGGARWLNEHVHGPPCIPEVTGGHRPLIVAPTLGDAVESVQHAPSSLKAQNPDVRVVTVKGGTEVRWPNGVRARMLGANTSDDVERLRAGGGTCAVWAEEYAAWRKLDEAWPHLQLGLREGTARMVVTTTPKPRQRLKELLKDPRTVMTTARTEDAKYLEPERRQELFDEYGGTRLGRQELEAELLEDVEGALWDADMIERTRWAEELPPLRRIVVAVDPPGGATECGIVVAGVCDRCPCGGTRQPHMFVVADLSIQASPKVWGGRAVGAYQEWQADRVVGESNFGGDMVKAIVEGEDSSVSYKDVRASRGKKVRAEPIVSKYEQDRVHHVGHLAGLENELTTWEPDESDWSPNRLDALVWAGTELLVKGARRPARLVSSHNRRLPKMRA